MILSVYLSGPVAFEDASVVGGGGRGELDVVVSMHCGEASSWLREETLVFSTQEPLRLELVRIRV